MVCFQMNFSGEKKNALGTQRASGTAQPNRRNMQKLKATDEKNSEWSYKQRYLLHPQLFM